MKVQTEGEKAEVTQKQVVSAKQAIRA